MPGAPAIAQTPEEFYKGRTVTLVAPDAAGSGYDAYARLVSRFIADRIPGKPSVVVQNMPGAGGVIQVNTLYNVSPKDGTTFAIIMHGTIFRPIFDPREVRYKMDGFRYLGSVTPIVVIGAFNKDAPAKTAAELFDREVLIGGSGGTTMYLPQAVNGIVGTKMKLISGYRSTKDIMLAMERREVAGVVGIGLDSIQTHNEGNVEPFNILFQMGSVRAKELPNVPLIQEFAKSPEDKAALEAVFASFSIGRVFVTPQIPDDRYAALQAAFEATVKDPAFAEAAAKQKSSVGYVSPAEIKTIVDKVYALPPAIQKRAADAIGGAG
jgi:tripartite-type tricarboxylate transporter receptor subunit TctC